jgi:hypothetical protein
LHNQGEVAVIDHSTTSAEAATHAGGRSGRGGDFLWRWGTPANYGAPGAAQLRSQHDAHWLGDEPEAPRPPGDAILIYDNQATKDGSAVKEISTPAPDDRGRYPLDAGHAYGPAAPTWTYGPTPGFFSMRISSAQRLPNDNTLIDAGESCRVFEVTPGGEIVWELDLPDTVATKGCFRAYRYSRNYAGLAGRALAPLRTPCPAN